MNNFLFDIPSVPAVSCATFSEGSMPQSLRSSLFALRSSLPLRIPDLLRIFNRPVHLQSCHLWQRHSHNNGKRAKQSSVALSDWLSSYLGFRHGIRYCEWFYEDRVLPERAWNQYTYRRDDR